MKTYSINSIGLLSMLILLSFDLCATDVVLNGRVRYYDSQTGTYKPVANAEIQIYTINPTVSPSPVVYTDNNGNFNKYLNVYPDQVDAHLFLRNEKIDLRGAITTRSIANIAVKINHPSCPDPLIPCHPWTTPPDFENMDMDLTGDEANYALIFDHANKAANFSIAQGFTPSQCIVKYPLQSSIINQVWISAKGSFFWPSSTVTFPPPDQNFFETILSGIISLAAWFGYTGELTANTIYINDLVKYNPSTVYHEYGHFIMKQKRGDWPVSQIEYATGVVPFDHNPGDAQQNSRQAYIEGWANYYEMAVSGWVANPASPYTVVKAEVDHVSNGYNHEYTIGNVFWDFYDPVNDENFQTSYANISNVMGENQNVMSDFISTLAHKSYITDQQRNAGIALMNLSSNKMNPLTSYGNATMYVKNDFNGGIVNINGGDVNTSSLGGAFSTTELWMSTYRPLLAKEQMYDNYLRLFKHTNPMFPSDTWTTELTTKKNITETWGVYTDALTFTANFDRACNITLTKYGLESATTFENTATSFRSETPVNISAPDIAQGGISYKFVNWSDGSTANPRQITVNQHQEFTANYKSHLASNSSTALSGNGQKKVLRDVSGMYHAVYESAGRIFHTTNPDGGSSWTNEVYLSSAVDGSVGYSRNPAIDLYYDASALTWKPIVTWEYRTADNSGFNIAARRIQGTSWGPVEYVTQGYPVYTSNDGTPALAYPYIIYRGDDALYLAKCFSAENGVWMSGAAIPGTSSASQSPTAIYDRWKGTGLTHLSWDEDNTVYYRNMLNPADYNFQWSSIETVASGNEEVMNTNPCVTMDNAGYVWLAWQYRYFEVINSNRIKARKRLSANSYGAVSSFGAGSGNPSYYAPSISGNRQKNSNNDLSIAWHKNNNDVQRVSYVNGSWGSIATESSNNQTPQLVFNETGMPFTNKLGLSRHTSGTLYSLTPIAFSESGDLEKSSTPSRVPQYTRSVTTTTDSLEYIVEFGEVQLQRDGGSTEYIGLVSLPDTVPMTTVSEITPYLRSMPFIATEQSILSLELRQYLVRGAAVTHEGSDIEYMLDFVDNESKRPLYTMAGSLLSEKKTLIDVMPFRFGVTSGKQVFIQLSIVPKGKVAATFTLSNDYRESVSDALGKREIRQRATTIDLLPTEYSLEQNYPNPFNPSTTISYALPQDGLTTLKVYDALGREVAELVNEFKPTGRYTASFDASRLSSGVYVYRLVSDKYSAVKKMLMLK